MKNLATRACLALILSLRAFCQTSVPTFKTEVRNTFIWGDDAPAGAISSSLKDPLTGAEILKLTHNHIEVSSRMGFEKLRPEDTTEFIAYFTTIANNTESELTVEQGEFAVDGRLVAPLSVGSNIKRVKKKPSHDATEVDTRNLHCLNNDRPAGKGATSLHQASLVVTVPPQSSSTVSAVVRDPRPYPLLCSTDGCFPKGTFRYSIRVGGHEYIFTWDGHSVINCGK